MEGHFTSWWVLGRTCVYMIYKNTANSLGISTSMTPVLTIKSPNYLPTRILKNEVLLEIILNNITSQSRWLLSMCNKWLYKHTIEISMNINAMIKHDTTPTPIYLYFNIWMESPNTTPRKQLIMDVYRNRGPVNKTYVNCYHLTRLIKCHNNFLDPFTCWYGDYDVLDFLISRLTVYKNASLCAGVLAYRGFDKLVVAFVARTGVDNISILVNASIGTQLRGNDATQIWKQYISVYDQQKQACIYNTAEAAATILMGKMYRNGRWEVYLGDITYAMVCACSIESIRKVGKAFSKELILFARELYIREYTTLEMMSTLAEINASSDVLQHLLIDDGLPAKLVDVILPYSNIINVILCIPKLRAQTIRLYMKNGMSMDDNSHKSLLGLRVDDDIFELIIELLQHDCVAPQVYYAGIKYAAQDYNGGRIRRLIELANPI